MSLPLKVNLSEEKAEWRLFEHQLMVTHERTMEPAECFEASAFFMLCLWMKTNNKSKRKLPTLYDICAD